MFDAVVDVAALSKLNQANFIFVTTIKFYIKPILYFLEYKMNNLLENQNLM